MLLSSLLLVPNVAHAATGVVSVNGGATIISAQTDTTVNVPINIAGSDALNGFDILVSVDPTILSGASVSVTGSVLSSPRILIECINGILVVGTTCAPQDANGVVDFGVATLGSPTTAPTSGLLFTITYNIVGHSPSTPISFTTGCTGTSVAGDCVLITNAGAAVSETDQGATYSNLNDFTMKPDFAAISAPAGSPITDNINYVAEGAFVDILSETVNAGPCSLAVNSVNLAFGPTGSDTLSCNSATNTDFTATVTATGSSSGTTHSTTIKYHAGPTGFSSTLNQASISIAAGNTDSTTIVTLKGVSGFSGTVSITATGPAGITGSASPSMVTLTNDGSGNSKGTSTLTVAAASNVNPGTYSLAITGGSTLSVVVVPKDFSIATVPGAESVERGGSAASNIVVCSIGNFAGPVNLSATIVPGVVDAGTGINNIGTSFLPATVNVPAGGCSQSAFSATTVKIGTSPNPANTQTGFYTAIISAASGSGAPHTTSLAFNVEDFSFGPSFCPSDASGSSQIFTTPNGFNDPVNVGEQCNTFTLTTQTTALGGGQSTLWLQVNSLGGFQSFGADGHGVAAVNPFGPGRGSFVPALGRSVCFFQVFLTNGTQLSRSYIRANGPIVRDNAGSGCRFGGFASPNDVEAPTCSPGMVNATCATVNNVDFFALTADALPTTLPGTYLINVCGLSGPLLNCQMVTLDVVQAAIVHQFVYTHTVSISAGGLQTFKLGVTNPDLNFAVFAQVTITATDQFGGTAPPLSTAVFKINPNANANNIALSLTFTSADKGKTFTFTTSILESATDPGAVTVDSFNGVTGAGTSTVQSVIAIFTVTN